MNQSGVIGQLAKIMQEIRPISKDHTNPKQGWKFRSYEDFYNGIQPLMAKHEVVCIPEVLKSERHEVQLTNSKATKTYLTVKYSFFAVDGSCVSTVVEGESMDTGDKSTSKALTMAYKYALMQIFMVPFADVKDPDNDVYEVPKQTLQFVGSTKEVTTLQPKSHMESLLARADSENYMIEIGSLQGQLVGNVDEMKLAETLLGAENALDSLTGETKAKTKRFIEHAKNYLKDQGAPIPTPKKPRASASQVKKLIEAHAAKSITGQEVAEELKTTYGESLSTLTVETFNKMMAVLNA